MKMKNVVAFTEMQFNGPDKRNQEKVVVTKICFHSETKQKVKVGATKIQLDGSGKKGN